MNRLFWSLFVVFFASTVGAQSLTEVAKKEKERRKKLETKDSQPITEQDLRRSYRGIPMTTSTTSATTEEESSEDATDEDESEETEEQDPRQTESYWRGRLSPVDERIKKMEADLNSPRYTSNARGGREREDLERRLAAARTERQAIVDEARRAGAPPGWLR